MRKLPYVSRLLPFSTDEEAAASKRMVIYAFSAQINLFTSFFIKQTLRNTVFILFHFNIDCDWVTDSGESPASRRKKCAHGSTFKHIS